MLEHEQEIALLRNRITELEAHLAIHNATTSDKDHRANGREGPMSNGLATKSLQMANVLQALLDHLNLVVWSVDDKGFFTFHDGKGGEPMGITAGSLLGKNIFELFEDTGGVRDAMRGKTHHAMSYLDKMVWENWYVPVKADNDDTCHVIGLSLDVTAAHQARAELEAKVALIEKQQSVIEDLETPIIQVWDRILTLPMVGVVDSRRAARVTEDLLTEVSRAQARFAILDLTGVEVVDPAKAGYFFEYHIRGRLSWRRRHRHRNSAQHCTNDHFPRRRPFSHTYARHIA